MASLALSFCFSLGFIDKSNSVLAHKAREKVSGEIASQTYTAIWGVFVAGGIKQIILLWFLV